MAKMRKWATADSETNPFDGTEVKPFIWAFYDGEICEIFEGPGATKNFINYIKEFNGIIYAHNGGRFDWMFSEIISAIDDAKPLMLINGRIAKARIGKCEIRDSWLCLPDKLSAFAKDDFDYTWLLPENRDKRRAEIISYITSDVKNLYEPLARFFEDNGQALTQAGASLKDWENMGGNVRRYGPHHDAKFRPYYFGGRVEVFNYANGEPGPFNIYDVNSAYPYAMTFQHPLGTRYYQTDDLSDIKGGSFWTVIAKSRGALPIRKKDGGVDFPNDNEPREYKVTGWELLCGIETGTLDILSGIGLVPMETESMRPFVEKCVKIKEAAEKAGDKTGRLLAKLKMNSCYGKYAANPESYKEYILDPRADTEEAGGWCFDRLLTTPDGPRGLFWRPAQRAQFFDVALAASITGHARANLWRAINSCEGVIYCDTDSVLCQNGAKLDRGGKLGQWDDEGEIARAWIAGKKLYALEKTGGGYKTASKGVKATPAEIKRVCAGEVVLIKNDAPTMKIDGRQIFQERHIKIT